MPSWRNSGICLPRDGEYNSCSTRAPPRSSRTDGTVSISYDVSCDMGRRARTGDEPLLRVTEPEAQQPPAQRVPDAITGRIASILEFYQFQKARFSSWALYLQYLQYSCSIFCR